MWFVSCWEVICLSSGKWQDQFAVRFKWLIYIKLLFVADGVGGAMCIINISYL